MAQARGSKTQLLLDFESAYNTDPASPAAYRLPFNSCGVKSSRNLNSAGTITGTRNPVEPFDGNTDVSGALEVPLDGRAMLYWLRAAFGSPARTAGPTTTLDAAGAVDKGGGLVGLPCTAHGMTAGDQVQISGTSNYDGVHQLHASTSADELVIAATFASESFAGTEVATPCIQEHPDEGAAVNKGGGLVGIPCTGHGLPVGAEITIAGSVNYNGTFQVERGTSANEIVITDAYVSETFDGEETILALFWSQAFSIGDTMPSLVLDKGFTDIGKYAKHGGCKIGKMSLSVGGDGELIASMDVMGASEALGSSAYDASPATVAMQRFKNFQASLTEDGATLTTNKATSLSLDMDFGLDGDQYCIGDGGIRGDLPEGTMALSGTLTALFEDLALLTKAINSTETSLTVSFVRGHHSLTVELEEMVFGRSTPGIEGPQGIRQELPFQAYYADGSNGSAVVVTLVTDIKTFA